MAFNGKRKFTVDDSEEDHVECIRPTFKQLKLSTAHFAAASVDNDMAMSDASYIPFPTSALSHRSPSSSSIYTSSSSTASPNYTLSSLQYPTTPASSYPHFDIYPEVEIGMDVDMDASNAQPRSPCTSTESTDSPLGLLQPSTESTVFQHGGNCTQIPRLRLSSVPGLNGTRTLWSHCESCGAIEMVKA